VVAAFGTALWAAQGRAGLLPFPQVTAIALPHLSAKGGGRCAFRARFIDHDARNADEILRLVDLCLRILGTEEAPGLEIRLSEDAQVDATLARLEDLAGRHPGSSIVRVSVQGEPSDEPPRLLRLRVDITEDLLDEVRMLEDVRTVEP